MGPLEQVIGDALDKTMKKLNREKLDSETVQVKEEGIYGEIDAHSDSESKEQSNWKGPIVGGVLGSVVGSLLVPAFSESMVALGLTVMGGVLGALAGYSLTIKGKKHEVKVEFPTSKEIDLYLNATPLIEKYIQDKVDRGA